MDSDRESFKSPLEMKEKKNKVAAVRSFFACASRLRKKSKRLYWLNRDTGMKLGRRRTCRRREDWALYSR